MQSVACVKMQATTRFSISFRSFLPLCAVRVYGERFMLINGGGVQIHTRSLVVVTQNILTLCSA